MEQGRSEAVFMDEISAADKEPEQGRSGELWGFMMSPLPFFEPALLNQPVFSFFAFPFFFISHLFAYSLFSDPPYAQNHLILRPLPVSYHFFPGIFISTSGKIALYDMISPARLKSL